MFSVGLSSKPDVVHVFMINFSMKRVFSDVDPTYKILVCYTPVIYPIPLKINYPSAQINKNFEPKIVNIEIIFLSIDLNICFRFSKEALIGTVPQREIRKIIFNYSRCSKNLLPAKKT